MLSVSYSGSCCTLSLNVVVADCVVVSLLLHYIEHTEETVLSLSSVRVK